VVHQRPQLLPWLSVTENVMLGKLPARKGLMIDRRKADELTRDLLARFRLDIDPRCRSLISRPPTANKWP